MKFINKGKDVQVRIPEGPNRYRWTGVRTGEKVDLPESIGLAYKFKRVTDVIDDMKPIVTAGKIGKTKVETKQIESEKDFIKNQSNFRFKLNEIDGIGLKTALDIIKVFPTEEKLKEAISHDDELPFRDDIEIKLRRKYG